MSAANEGRERLLAAISYQAFYELAFHCRLLIPSRYIDVCHQSIRDRRHH